MAFKGKEIFVDLKWSTNALLCLFYSPQDNMNIFFGIWKGQNWEVQNYIGTKKKILLKIIVESVLFKWPWVPLCLISTNYFDSWENYRASRKRFHN